MENKWKMEKCRKWNKAYMRYLVLTEGYNIMVYKRLFAGLIVKTQNTKIFTTNFIIRILKV